MSSKPMSAADVWNRIVAADSGPQEREIIRDYGYEQYLTGWNSAIDAAIEAVQLEMGLGYKHLEDRFRSLKPPAESSRKQSRIEINK